MKLRHALEIKYLSDNEKVVNSKKQRNTNKIAIDNKDKDIKY